MQRNKAAKGREQTGTVTETDCPNRQEQEEGGQQADST